MVYNVVISYNIWFIIYNYNDGNIYIYMVFMEVFMILEEDTWWLIPRIVSGL